MSIGKQEILQCTMWITYDQIPKGQGHAYNDHLYRILCKCHFDAFSEQLCAPFYAERMEADLPFLRVGISGCCL